jgi:hypothetical protein
MNRSLVLSLAFVTTFAALPGITGTQAHAQAPQPAPAAQPPAATAPAPPAATMPTPPTEPPPQAGIPAPGIGGTGPAAFGFSFTAPQGWTQATDTSSINVPGEVCCAWSPDGTSTLTVFRQRPKGAVSPRVLLDASTKAFQTSLGATVDEQAVRDVGGMRAMWMIITGKGTGAAIDGKGTVPTSQHWVAIPRSNDVLIFLLIAPQDKFATYDGALQQALASIQLTGQQTAAQKAAK